MNINSNLLKKVLILFLVIVLPFLVHALGPVESSSLAPGTLHLAGNPGTLNTSGILLYSHFDPSINGFASQDFEVSQNDYDCKGADDFLIPAGRKWRVDEIKIRFYYFGSFPAPTVNMNVQFYEDNSGVPGAVIAEFLDFPVNSANLISNGTIPLPNSVLLNEGTKWISVQFRYDYLIYGQSYWSGSSVQTGNDAMWINPGGLFGFGTGWLPAHLISMPPIYDFQFALYGTDGDAVPFPLLGSILLFLGVGATSFIGLRKKRN